MLQSSEPSSVSAAKVAANRVNCLKSTGPRTPRGKAVAARNSLKHGLFARSLLLPGEDAAELTSLKTALLRRLNPRDPMELVLVERIVSATWKLQRLERFEAALYAQQCDAWDEDPANNREDHGLGRREPVTAEIAWVTGSLELHAQLDRLTAQERHLESGLRRNLRQLTMLQEQSIPEIVDDFADQTIVAEHSARENRENEVTAVTKASRQAAVEAIREARRDRDDKRLRELEQKAKNEAKREARELRSATEKAHRERRGAKALAECQAQTQGNGATGNASTASQTSGNGATGNAPTAASSTGPTPSGMDHVT